MNKGPHRIAVVIPAYNEEKSISSLLKDIPADLVDEVVVVDNNSNDRTSQLAEQGGATVLFERARGYGSACLRGIEYVMENSFDIIVFIDADYSDHPEEMGRLLKPIISEGYDMVIGSRSSGQREKGAMPAQAIFGNWLATLLIKLFWGYRYTDLGPFRAITTTALKRIGMEDRDFGWTVEMQIKAARYNLRAAEVPVSYRKRIGTSKISGTISGSIKAGYKILYVIGKYAFKK